MDSFRRDLGYFLLLLIGLGFFFPQPIDHGWRFAAKGGMWAFAVVELDPFADTGLRLRPGLPGVQIDAFVFQAPPEPFHKDAVREPSFPSIDTRTPDRRKRSVQAKDVN